MPPLQIARSSRFLFHPSQNKSDGFVNSLNSKISVFFIAICSERHVQLARQSGTSAISPTGSENNHHPTRFHSNPFGLKALLRLIFQSGFRF
jgi:hypothetical protein